MAVIEKAKTCGGHNLSGAVMRPGPLQELYPDLSREQWREEGFAFGEVVKESVYMLPSGRTKLRIPTPPPFKNHGNEVVSVSALARFQQRTAEEAGAFVLTETSASQLLVQDGRVVGVRTGDKGRDREGEPKGNFEPGSDVTAKAVVLAEGCWGHLTGAAIKEFDLGEGREPQVWELGVKEVWQVPKPLDRVIHTIGPWPLKLSSKYGQIGGTWIYPMKDERTGDDLVSIGFVIDLEYADATTSAHDLLQLFKTHPLVRGILEGGERVSWGAKALPGGGYWSMPKLTMPGALLAGDSGGMVDTVALKGVHHSITLGPPRRGGHLRGAQGGVGDFSAYEEAIEDLVGRPRSSTGCATRASRSRRASSRAARSSTSRSPPRAGSRAGAGRGTATTRGRCSSATPPKRYPKPDGKYTFDKLSSVFITGNATRDDAPNHIRVQKRVPRVVAETWAHMCPAGVYEIPEDQRGRPRRRHRQLHELRAVRGDHREGRSPDDPRGRRRAALPEHLSGPPAARGAPEHETRAPRAR